MNKYKVGVYAISKNEEKFVDRWVDSMQEADEIYVLDTGSSDHTIEKLKKRGVHVVTKEIKPWRFDVARNASLDLVPEDIDICVCTDLDEVFESGWREQLEKIWNDSITRLQYNYNWSLDENNKPLVNFYIEKIHKRKGYIWTHPVHEILTYQLGEEKKVVTDEITLNHYPDREKSRSSYLPLLELSVKEDPEDDRNMHYLGREYMYYGKWNECIDTLIHHLHLKRATWKDERCASMRFIARSYTQLKRYDEAKMWLEKAIDEAPYLRDPYIEMGLLCYKLEEYQSVVHYVTQALQILNHPKSYINEPFSYNETPYDLLAVSYYYLNDLDKSYQNAMIAVSMNPEDERLKNNLKLIEQARLEKETSEDTSTCQVHTK